MHPSYGLEYEKAQPSLTSVLFHRLKQIYCLQQEQSAGAALEATELRNHTTIVWHQAIVHHHDSSHL